MINPKDIQNLALEMANKAIEDDIKKMEQYFPDAAIKARACLKHFKCIGCLDTGKIIYVRDGIFTTCYDEYTCSLCSVNNELVYVKYHNKFTDAIGYNNRQIPSFDSHKYLSYSHCKNLVTIYDIEFAALDKLDQEFQGKINQVESHYQEKIKNIEQDCLNQIKTANQHVNVIQEKIKQIELESNNKVIKAEEKVKKIEKETKEQINKIEKETKEQINKIEKETKEQINKIEEETKNKIKKAEDKVKLKIGEITKENDKIKKEYTDKQQKLLDEENRLKKEKEDIDNQRKALNSDLIPLWGFGNTFNEFEREINSVDIKVDIKELISDISKVIALSIGNMAVLPDLIAGLDANLNLVWSNSKCKNYYTHNVKDENGNNRYIRFDFIKISGESSMFWGLIRTKGSFKKEFLYVSYLLLNPLNQAAISEVTDIMNKDFKTILDKFKK